MSNLVNHAKTELEKAGMMDKNNAYNYAVAESVLELMEVFSKQGHSGFSASMTREIFDKVSSFKVLSSITSNPDEWMDRTEESGEPMWQNKRQPSTFSRDGGKTWYDLDDNKAR